MEIFNEFFESNGGLQFISRYAHILSGVAWIGLLYFFNFVQVPAFAEMEAPSRSEALRKVTWRALWWFRWAAMSTFLFGLAMVGIYSAEDNSNYLEGGSGTSIMTGMLFGITMWANVWMVIWPAQKINIGSAERVAQGGEADPAAAGAAKKAARASRVNTLFSIPMLWFMVFTSHYSFNYADGTVVENSIVYWIITLVIWAFIEASALGYIGGLDNAFNKEAFDDHKRTIAGGFILLVVLMLGWEFILNAN